MANQREHETEPNETSVVDNPDEEPELPRHGPKPPGLKDKLLERVPPKYRAKRYLIGVPTAAVALLVVLIQCNAASGPGSEALPDPTPAAVETTPEPTPVTALLPDRPTPMPSQYSFAHFVEEMADCYKQQGLASSPEAVEADIMADVPVAVNALMRLYADNLCQEEDQWHQIRGRMGWMLRAGDVPLPDLPQAEEPQQ